MHLLCLNRIFNRILSHRSQQWIWLGKARAEELLLNLNFALPQVALETTQHLQGPRTATMSRSFRLFTLTKALPTVLMTSLEVPVALRGRRGSLATQTYRGRPSQRLKPPFLSSRSPHLTLCPSHPGALQQLPRHGISGLMNVVSAIIQAVKNEVSSRERRFHCMCALARLTT